MTSHAATILNTSLLFGIMAAYAVIILNTSLLFSVVAACEVIIPNTSLLFSIVAAYTEYFNSDLYISINIVTFAKLRL
jgi:hypothetical protein